MKEIMLLNSTLIPKKKKDLENIYIVISGLKYLQDYKIFFFFV